MEWAKVRRRAAKAEAQTAPLGYTQPCTPTMQEFRYQQRRHLTRSGTQHDPDSGRRGRGAALPAKPAHQRFVRLAERRARCGGRGAVPDLRPACCILRYSVSKCSGSIRSILCAPSPGMRCTLTAERYPASVVYRTDTAAMFSTQWVSHCLTVQALPGLRTFPELRSCSSSWTALLTSASVLRLTWRLSGLPSSSTPTVTRPCYRPSYSL
ncbi:MAG: hypothetical protein QOH09_496 [Pseudonocardiales bacterium]|nr:hypothetical protein [Pseudonocardiales bacterium]